VEEKVIEDIIRHINERFGKESPLTTSRGKVLEYLGLTLDYSTRGKVKISMCEYVKKLVEDAPDDMAGVTKTPAGNHLFTTNPECDKFPEKTAQVFHHIVAKLLYLCKRTRQDIQTAMAFLCTRVKDPDSDDCKKLTCVIQYLRGTQDTTLTIEPADHPNWWVDSSYAVHPDMHSHSGMIMMLGKGAMYSCSYKQKLNTKSITEAELVGINDAMGQVLWTCHFLAAQGE